MTKDQKQFSMLYCLRINLFYGMDMCDKAGLSYILINKIEHVKDDITKLSNYFGDMGLR